MTAAIDSVQPAVILANVRTGGTFLSHCLSNHPDIYCPRGEIMHKRGIWRQTLNNVNLVELLHCTLHQPHYRISMCKLTYSQAFNESLWNYLQKLQPYVIWLQRENILRQAVSVILVKLNNKGAINHPPHAACQVPQARVTLDPAVVLNHAHGLIRRENQIAPRMKIFDNVLRLTYEEITARPVHYCAAPGLNSAAGTRIAAFFKIRDLPMRTDLMRVNPQPLAEIIENWSDVRAAIAQSDLERFLEGEDG